MAIALFASSRPPGIYKPEYIDKLFEIYGDSSMVKPIAPPLPTWDEDEADDGVDDDGEDIEPESSNQASTSQNGYGNGGNKQNFRKRARREDSKLNPHFADPNLQGVEACIDPDEIARVRMAVQNICEWNGFDKCFMSSIK